MPNQRQGTTPRGDSEKPSVAESMTKGEETESTRAPAENGELKKADQKKWVKIHPQICDCQWGSFR